MQLAIERGTYERIEYDNDMKIRESILKLLDAHCTLIVNGKGFRGEIRDGVFTCKQFDCNINVEYLRAIKFARHSVTIVLQ